MQRDLSVNRLLSTRNVVGAILCQPPIGVVAVTALVRWYKRLYADETSCNRNGNGRLSLRMDPTDWNDYAIHGGVDNVRQSLVLAALRWHFSKSSQPAEDEEEEHDLELKTGPGKVGQDQASEGRISKLRKQLNNDLQPVRLAAIQALDVDALVTNRHPNRRVQYLHSLIEKWTNFESLWLNREMPDDVSGQQVVDWGLQEQLELMNTAGFVLQLRLMDSLLRTYRDGLLRACQRLDSQRNQLIRRIENQSIRDPSSIFSFEFWKSLLHSVFPGSMFLATAYESDRMRLVTISSSYDAELIRLGSVQRLLHQRHEDLDEANFADAVKSDKANVEETRTENPCWVAWRKVVEAFNVALNKSNLLVIDGKAASTILTRDDSTDQEQIEKWIRSGAALLSSGLSNIIKTSEMDEGKNQTQLWFSFQRLVERWKSPDVVLPKKDWFVLVSHCSRHEDWRRRGELPKAGFSSWCSSVYEEFKQAYNGIPMLIVQVALGQTVASFLKPKLPLLQAKAGQMVSKTGEIVDERVLKPLKGIYDDLMNKNPGLFSSLSLDVEESTLDNMLRDLNLSSDGTEATRLQALEAAAKEYEKAVIGSVMWSTVQGKLAKLLLIQVQHLKVGLLTALDTIDVLVQGNRIHLQVLAIVPAVIVASYGTRLCFRFLFHVRSRDLRSVRTLHGEMTATLERIRRHCLDRESRKNPRGRMHRHELFVGSVLLCSYTYLTQLEYCRPLLQSSESTSRKCHTVQIAIADLSSIILDDSRSFPNLMARLDSIDKVHANLVF